MTDFDSRGDTEGRPLRGASSTLVRDALETCDPFPGTAGFAGWIDGALVRDVLGRVPLFVEEPVLEGDVSLAPDRVAFSPIPLAEPALVPAGSRLGPAGLEQVWSIPEIDVLEPEASGGDDATAIDAVDDAITTAIDAVDVQNVAVAFSGGVDSALVAELLDAPLYVVGFQGCHDVEAARTAAEAMGRDLTVVSLEPSDLERATPAVARAIGRTNAMDVQIALPLYLVAERIAADGFDAMAVGQGADELFGGYEKVVHLDHRVESETVRGAVQEQIETLSEQLPRDVLAVEAAGVEPVAPLLHDAVVEAALALPPHLLADEDERKRALRAVASRYLPDSVARREKKAVQYGSLVARELDRLARQAGYKRRMDDHVTTYVESLCSSDN
ncbi:asparagine synthase C-terminal domain-containing protein [Natronosalvus rutilus]|uniref:Asparagine synthase-related protein n=1 Tax=Natronosalvus rutilus TaxID=2953753 RepID=A0A9E7N7B1_9EURY|nr:asparagine synthase-related protein [Natronosalvus rutilus]UTF53039.1 asparagine synthase-related protein [Natronosalvus rutilus]